jgi:hypothetical protein
MTHEELDRFGVISRVRERRLTQVEAARILDLGVRQVQRLCAAVARDGADGLISRKRGRPSSRRFPENFRRSIVTLISAHYSDFGPSLACEKLLERHGIAVSNGTVRKLMIEAGLWRTRAQRKPKVQQPPVAGKHVTVFDYPDGRFKIRFEGRELPYKVFDRLRQIRQGDIVNSKRLGSVLTMAREAQLASDERRSKSCPSRPFPSASSMQ